MNTALKLENVSKQYRLGVIGTGTIAHDLNRWWALLRGKEDPYSKVGEVNAREVSAAGEYVWALKDVNLEVEQGTVLGIIGRNGAGKSTLLKLLSRVTAPTTGLIKGRGRIASLLEVGTGFHPELTGRENIYMNGAVLGMRRFEITERLEDIVEFSGCQKYLDTPVKRYSSGMTVRLGFAVAAHLNCEILIVDEVLAVGDLEFQSKCIGKMKEVSQTGRTVLFVSHNLDSVRNLCSKCIVIEKGSITLDGTVNETVDAYLDSTRRLSTEFCASSDEVEKDVKIERVKIASQSGTASFDISEQISIEIGCRVQRPTKGLHLSIQARSIGGVPIVTSTTADFQLESEIKEAGYYVFHTSIPEFFLNSGAYELHVAPFVLGGRLMDLVQGLLFEVHDRHSSWPSKPFNRDRQGVVVNQLEWKCEMINQHGAHHAE